MIYDLKNAILLTLNRGLFNSQQAAKITPDTVVLPAVLQCVHVHFFTCVLQTATQFCYKFGVDVSWFDHFKLGLNYGATLICQGIWVILCNC